jgi:hypothetical protein
MKLKRVVGLFLIMMLPCSLFTLLGYQIGIHHTAIEAKDWQRTTFVLSFCALEELQAGNTPAATDNMRQICFAHAHKIYSDLSFVDDHFVMFCSFRLVKYFDTYCTNRTHWSREETLLNEDLNLLRHTNSVVDTH